MADLHCARSPHKPSRSSWFLPNKKARPVIMSSEEFGAIDEWRRKHPDQPSVGSHPPAGGAGAEGEAQRVICLSQYYLTNLAAVLDEFGDRQEPALHFRVDNAHTVCISTHHEKPGNYLGPSRGWLV